MTCATQARYRPTSWDETLVNLNFFSQEAKTLRSTPKNSHSLTRAEPEKDRSIPAMTTFTGTF